MPASKLVRFPSIEEYPDPDPAVLDPPTRSRLRCRLLDVVSMEPAMFLFCLSTGLSAPTHQALIYRKTCLNLFNASICDDLGSSAESNISAQDNVYLEATQTHTSQFEFYANLCFNVPALLAVALFGSWSDTFSRKVPLLFAPVGSILYTIVMLLNALFIDSSVYFILIGQFLDGLTGGYSCFLMAVFSYSSHVTTERNRTSRFSIVYACQTLGFTIATFSSGIFLEHTSFAVVYLTNIGILLLMLLYIILGIKDISPEDINHGSPERYSRMSEQEEESKWSMEKATCFKKMAALFDLSHMKKAFTVTFKRRLGKLRQYILVLVSVAFLIMVTHAISVNYLFYRHPPLSLTQSEYGVVTGVASLVGFTGQALALPGLRALRGPGVVGDEGLLVASIVSDMLARLWTGFCVHKWMVLVTPFIGYLKPFEFTCIRALLACLVSQDEFGKINAVVAWIETLAALGASFIYGKCLYPATLDTNPGISFMVSAVLMLIPLMLAIWLCISLKRQKSAGTEVSLETATKQTNDLIEELDMDAPAIREFGHI